MNILITGAAGNLGSFLTRHLLNSPHQLRLLIHHKDVPPETAAHPNVNVFRADLGNPNTLTGVCDHIDCIVHFAGVLFASQPEKFLPKTNVEYIRNLTAVALKAEVKKFVLISFPHVEGETTPNNRANGRLDGNPNSVHAQTRLAAEKHILSACSGTKMTAVILRAGMIYGRGVLMIEAARWLLRHRLLAVWPEPTWTHLLTLPDFLSCTVSAIEGERIEGIYCLGDDRPLTLQEFLDAIAMHWSYPKPWRCPKWIFPIAAGCCEWFARLFGTASPLTRDFIKIGMVSSVSDTSRMKKELQEKLAFPCLDVGLQLL